MAANRLELFIDVLELEKQRALVLPGLKVGELIGAILSEFTELEHLGGSPEAYQLLKKADRTPLVNTVPVAEQAQPKEALVLVEYQTPLPPGATRISRQAYLREQSSGQVYQLHWQPALIGRPDRNQQQGELLAINLESHSTGLRVSRRHAKITEINGRFFIESMSGNPTLITNEAGKKETVEQTPQELQDGDIIVLERSNISLKLLLRDTMVQPPALAEM